MKEVVTCFPLHRGKVLLLKRSEDVSTYPGKWGTVTGYLDQEEVEAQCLEELIEELGLSEEAVIKYEHGETFSFSDNGHDWQVHPVAAHIDEEKDFDLNMENTEYKWVDPQDVKMFDTVPRLTESLKKALKMRDEE